MGVQNKTVDHFIRADCVVVGTVKGVEENGFMASAGPPDPYKLAYRVAEVEVKEALAGARAGSTLRVGFRPGNSPVYKERDLRPGDEGVFFLSRHHEQPFYVIKQPYLDSLPYYTFGIGAEFRGGNLGGAVGRPLGGAPGGVGKQPAQPVLRRTEFLSKEDPAYDRELALARRCGQLLGNPKAGLKSAKAEDRLLTAAILLGKYRGSGQLFTYLGLGRLPAPAPKTQPIDAEESRLILGALVGTNLEQTNADLGIYPLGLFRRLGLKKEDGWAPPQTNQKDYAAAAQRWLQANANTYCIQRIVEEKPKAASEADPPGKVVVLRAPPAAPKDVAARPEQPVKNDAPAAVPPAPKNAPPPAVQTPLRPALPAPLGPPVCAVESSPETQPVPPPAPVVRAGFSAGAVAAIAGLSVLLTALLCSGTTVLLMRRPAPEPRGRKKETTATEPRGERPTPRSATPRAATPPSHLRKKE